MCALWFAGVPAPLVQAQPAAYPAPVERDFVARDVRFDSGEVAPEIRLHYRTIGQPRKDADGVVRNAVLILHGTGGTGAGFVSPGYAGLLFGAGQLLDATKYFIILPGQFGNGVSTSPSNAAAPFEKGAFPSVTHADDARAQHKLVTEQFGIEQLLLWRRCLPLGRRHRDGSLRGHNS